MWKRTTLLISRLFVGTLVFWAVPGSVASEPEPLAGGATEKYIVKEELRDVDLAICLDTSGSMSGLIESAKQKLWTIVNELATVKPRPRLRVALYQYGNDV